MVQTGTVLFDRSHPDRDRPITASDRTSTGCSREFAAVVCYSDRLLGNQDARLAYDKFRDMGLDIGSGRVEAACKSVVGIRMKRSGMRWSRRGSQTTLSLRVARMNGQWEALWAKLPLAA